MFKKEQNLNNLNEVETIIGESVQVKGNFESNGNIIVNGILDGEIKTKGAILVGDKAKINANIKAEEMAVKGKVIGNLKINGYLSIGGSAGVLGDIECSQISIEKGAEINGNIVVNEKNNKNDNKISKKETETEEDAILKNE
ncbi:MAG: polymer-forming cytoskeletal protein [Patescibacteria group bacterium]|nr:polymer-forming cytoskeletal protein [Patescibacteria group bacterium]